MQKNKGSSLVPPIDPQEVQMVTHIKSLSKPTWFTSNIVMKPCSMIGVTFMVMFIFFLVAQAKNYFEMEIPSLTGFID